MFTNPNAVLISLVPRTEMTATANIFHRTTLNIFDSRFFSGPQFVRSIDFLAESPSFFCGSVTRSRTMTEMVNTSAFRSARTSNDAEEGVTLMEQESLTDGSPNIMASGLESNLNRWSKWLLAGLFGVIIIWRHDSEALWALMGSVLNSLLSIVLKRIINQERPVLTLKSDPGMPSSHAQSIFFIISFIILSTVESLGINVATLMISGLALVFGSYLSWLRVSQKLHTISQVVVGAAVGSTFSLLWFLSWKGFVLEAFNSNPWVPIIVASGTAVFCAGFVFYVIRYWLKDE